ncbi:hypothetical protein K458DRAFT_396955 [Lentithecium fluviatile CBS 122367]|uniref:Uncharacterized protein n=1 Tax=Lentithecium fluviatile CBS 122367 TaxID=1168545 RepID=A0A6G1IEI6_9PLEO|nr:hypothetical protein K458DRAFT_396955 [Lentithecium fluviatile CBS 122367]
MEESIRATTRDGGRHLFQQELTEPHQDRQMDTMKNGTPTRQSGHTEEQERREKARSTARVALSSQQARILTNSECDNEDDGYECN